MIYLLQHSLHVEDTILSFYFNDFENGLINAIRQVFETEYRMPSNHLIEEAIQLSKDRNSVVFDYYDWDKSIRTDCLFILSVNYVNEMVAISKTNNHV